MEYRLLNSRLKIASVIALILRNMVYPVDICSAYNRVMANLSQDSGLISELKDLINYSHFIVSRLEATRFTFSAWAPTFSLAMVQHEGMIMLGPIPHKIENSIRNIRLFICQHEGTPNCLIMRAH
jgi:uncharacterized membrane protein